MPSESSERLGYECEREECSNICRLKVNRFCSRSCSMKVRFRDASKNPFVTNNPAKTDGSYARRKNAKRNRAKLDNHTCKRCGKKELGRERYKNVYGVHHIIPSKLFTETPEMLELRDSMRNLITLCGSCHKEIEFLTLRYVYDMYFKGYDFKDLGTLMDDLREKIESNAEIDLIDMSKQ